VSGTVVGGVMSKEVLILCRLHQLRLCAYDDRCSAPAISISSGAVSEGEKLAQVVFGGKALRMRYWG
jgi:hypothetical protein